MSQAIAIMTLGRRLVDVQLTSIQGKLPQDASPVTLDSLEVLGIWSCSKRHVSYFFTYLKLPALNELFFYESSWVHDRYKDMLRRSGFTLRKLGFVEALDPNEMLEIIELSPQVRSLYVDETAELFDQISVSAGVRGTLILLAPANYLCAVKGTLGPIARDN